MVGADGFVVGESVTTWQLDDKAYSIRNVAETTGLVSLFKRGQSDPDEYGRGHCPGAGTEGIHPGAQRLRQAQRSGPFRLGRAQDHAAAGGSGHGGRSARRQLRHPESDLPVRLVSAARFDAGNTGGNRQELLPSEICGARRGDSFPCVWGMFARCICGSAVPATTSRMSGSLSTTRICRCAFAIPAKRATSSNSRPPRSAMAMSSCWRRRSSRPPIESGAGRRL